MTDPRTAIIEHRLEGIREIIAVSSGKGGVGKSSVAAVLALQLHRAGRNVGLLDLDFYGPSAHILLGAPETVPEEAYGIVPPLVSGIRLMSVVYYSGKNPAPLRGEDVTNAIIELLAITRWGDVDTLVVDMPPGVGDPTLDAMRFLPRAKYLVVTTPSVLSAETVQRLITLLSICRSPVLGVVRNMCRQGDSAYVPAEGAPPEIAVRFDEAFEQAIGDPGRLLATAFADDIAAAAAALERPRAAV